MSDPVNFITEDNTIYALSSDGHTHYQFTLEAEGREQFCECQGFKWSNTESKRQARNGEIKDCKHLASARELAHGNLPRFRLRHGASNTILADNFTSVETMVSMLVEPSPFDYPLSSIRVERCVQTDGGPSWELVRMATSNVVAMPAPKVEQWYCKGCESITDSILWIDDKCPRCQQPYDMPCDHEH